MTCARARPAPSQRAHDVFPLLPAGAEPEAHARSKGKPVRRAALQCSGWACAAPSYKRRGSQTSGTAGSHRHPGSCLSLAPAAAPACPSSATLHRKAAAAGRGVLARARTLSGCMHGKPIRWACCMVIAGPSCARVARLQLAAQEDVAPQGHWEGRWQAAAPLPHAAQKVLPEYPIHKLTSSCIRTALYDCLLMHPTELSEQAASSAPRALRQGPVRDTCTCQMAALRPRFDPA